MKKLPRLQPLFLRPETEPGYEQVPWRPTWKCFCCAGRVRPCRLRRLCLLRRLHTGLVQYSLLRQIMPDYDDRRHKPVKCNASLCERELGEALYLTQTLDLRLDSSVCDELDSIGRRCWRDWEQQQHQLRKKALKRASSERLTGNLRVVKRSAAESSEVERRHQQIVNEY